VFRRAQRTRDVERKRYRISAEDSLPHCERVSLPAQFAPDARERQTQLSLGEHTGELPKLGANVHCDCLEPRGLKSMGEDQVMGRRAQGRGHDPGLVFHDREVGTRFVIVEALLDPNTEAEHEVVLRLVLLQQIACGMKEVVGALRPLDSQTLQFVNLSLGEK
jgi:hypothetical protein